MNVYYFCNGGEAQYVYCDLTILTPLTIHTQSFNSLKKLNTFRIYSGLLIVNSAILFSLKDLCTTRDFPLSVLNLIYKVIQNLQTNFANSTQC